MVESRRGFGEKAEHNIVWKSRLLLSSLLYWLKIVSPVQRWGSLASGIRRTDERERGSNCRLCASQKSINYSFFPLFHMHNSSGVKDDTVLITLSLSSTDIQRTKCNVHKVFGILTKKHSRSKGFCSNFDCF